MTDQKQRAREFYLFGYASKDNTVIGFINKPEEPKLDLLHVIEAAPALEAIQKLRKVASIFMREVRKSGDEGETNLWDEECAPLQQALAETEEWER